MADSLVSCGAGLSGDGIVDSAALGRNLVVVGTLGSISVTVTTAVAIARLSTGHDGRKEAKCYKHLNTKNNLCKITNLGSTEFFYFFIY